MIRHPALRVALMLPPLTQHKKITRLHRGEVWKWCRCGDDFDHTAGKAQRCGCDDCCTYRSELLARRLGLEPVKREAA